MMIPSRASAHLISTTQANTTAAVIRIAAGISPVQVTETIRPDRALVRDQVLVLTEDRDLAPTAAAVTIIIMVANRRTSSELAPDAPHFIQRNPATYVAGLGFMEAERFSGL
jgi:hypothetical protein